MRSFFLARYRNYKKHLAEMVVAAAAAATGLTAGSAEASSIFVPNASFETYTPMGASNYGSFTPGTDSWSGGAYTEIHAPAYVPSYVPVTNVSAAWSSLAVSQTLGTTWAAGDYTLSVYALTDNTATTTLTLSLRDGNTAAVVQSQTTPITTGLASAGQLVSTSVTVLPGNSIISHSIEILFTGNNGRAFYDNVSLTFTPAPEPGSLCLLGTSAVGLGLVARQRRRR